MRILKLLKFPFWGSGSGTYARKLAEKLAKLGNDVAIVAPDDRGIRGVKIYTAKLPFFVAITGHSEYPGCKLYSNLTPQEINAILASFVKTILKAVDEFKPDIIYVHHASFFTWIASYIRSIYNIPYIVIEHGTGILNSTLDRRYLTLTRDSLNHAEYIICVSGDTKRWFQRVYGKRHANKIRIIPGGVDSETYKHEAPIKIISKKYQLKDKKLVIFTGKLTKPKGTEYLVKAAPKIDAEIYILGSGDELSNLQEIVKEKKIKNVHFLGYFGPEYVKELKEFYRRADVFVCPSIWDEPLGLVVLEAMASGTPVVGSKRGGIPLAIKNNVNGFLVKARSSSAIADAVNKILHDPVLRKRLSKEARKTVEEKFNWLTIAQRYERISRNTIDIHQGKVKLTKKKLSYINVDAGKKELKGRKLDYI